MRYEIRDESVIFHLDNPRRTKDATVTQSFAGSGLHDSQISILLDGIVKKFRGTSLSSQQNIGSEVLRPIFSFFRETGKQWPETSADWQLTVYEFFQFYLSDTSWSKSRAGNRMALWKTIIGGLFEFFVEDEIIPRDVKIPEINIKKIRSISRSKSYLGDSSRRTSDISKQPSKLLVDISFGMNDADYLDTVEKQCRHSVRIIRDTCLAHWGGLMRDGEVGRKLSAKVPDSELDEIVLTGNYLVPNPRGSGRYIKYTSPVHPSGHERALSIFARYICYGNDVGCVSGKRIRSSPFFISKLFLSTSDSHSYNALDALTAMDSVAWQRLSSPAKFHRFAGLLSNVDVAAACCLLTIEHPEFTSESLQGAQILNVRGVSYLLLTDYNDRQIFSVDKPRSGVRKSVVLTDLSQKLIKDILQWSDPVRQVLRRAGDKTWRYLFLGIKHLGGAGSLGIVDGSTAYLARQNLVSLASLYPALGENGLTYGNFDFRRLRNTLGVIRWFETGSILEMSRRLGNTRKVALEHYLPPALLHAWNTRIIRRFQNTLIVLAAHDEPYLLEVSDFSSMADLQHFIAQLVVDFPARTSPLADEVQRRLGSDKQRNTLSSSSLPGLLNVRLSPKSLGLLYSYADLALRTLSSDDLDKIDALSGLAPRQFTNLATLLRHAAESDEIHASLSEVMDLPLLKNIHCEALAIQTDLDIKISKLAIKHRWAENS